MRLILAILLSLFMQYPAKSFTLCGGVSNEYGRIGILVSRSTGRIAKVYLHSPASGLLYPGDVVIEVDGKEDNVDGIDGTAGSIVTIKVKRFNDVKEFTFTRVPKREIYNKAKRIQEDI